MAARSNAMGEITRLWLQTRHGCLVDESLPVKVRYGHSDIDLVAIRPDMSKINLPNSTLVGPRLIIETKDEHDWEGSGKEFGAFLQADVQKMEGQRFIPKETKGVKFTMLREQHYERATSFFGTDDFDRIFALHACSSDVRHELEETLAKQRIYVVTIKEIVADLQKWYKAHPNPTTLRHTLIGDMWHLLVGYCGYGPST